MFRPRRENVAQDSESARCDTDGQRTMQRTDGPNSHSTGTVSAAARSGSPDLRTQQPSSVADLRRIVSAPRTCLRRRPCEKRPCGRRIKISATLADSSAMCHFQLVGEGAHYVNLTRRGYHGYTREKLLAQCLACPSCYSRNGHKPGEMRREKKWADFCDRRSGFLQRIMRTLA